MDIEKAMQFMLDSQARHDAAIAQHDAAVAQHNVAMAQHDAAIAEMDDRFDRIAVQHDKLSGAVLALADQQKLLSAGLSAVSEAFVRQMSQSGAMFQESDRRIGELAATVAEYVRKSESNKP